MEYGPQLSYTLPLWRWKIARNSKVARTLFCPMRRWEFDLNEPRLCKNKICNAWIILERRRETPVQTARQVKHEFIYPTHKKKPKCILPMNIWNRTSHFLCYMHKRIKSGSSVTALTFVLKFLWGVKVYVGANFQQNSLWNIALVGLEQMDGQPPKTKRFQKRPQLWTSTEASRKKKPTTFIGTENDWQRMQIVKLATL